MIKVGVNNIKQHISTPIVFYGFCHIKPGFFVRHFLLEFINQEFIMSPRNHKQRSASLFNSNSFILLPILGSDFICWLQLLPNLGSNFRLGRKKKIEVLHIQQIRLRKTSSIRVGCFQIITQILHKPAAPSTFGLFLHNIPPQFPIKP